MTRRELQHQLHKEFMENGKVELSGNNMAFKSHTETKNPDGDILYICRYVNFMDMEEISAHIYHDAKAVIKKYWGDLP